MAGVILQVPGGDRHFPRPPSPRHRRTSTYGGTGSTSGYMQVQEPGARSPEDRNVRRRTSTLSLPPPPPGSNSLPAPGSAYSQHYSVPNYGHQLGHHPGSHRHSSGRIHSPPNRNALPAPSQGVPPLLHVAPQPGPYNPYADRHDPSQHRESR
jgi:hypothetical protein